MSTKKTTKKTTKASDTSAEDIVYEEAGTVPDSPHMGGEGGFESRSKEDEILARLDRIIELLEGTVKVEKKGIDFDTPAWARFIK